MRFITTSLSVLICVGACATLWICLIVLLSWYVLMCYTKLRALISAQSYLVVFFVLCSIHLWHLQLLFCCHFTHVTIKYHRVSVHMPTCICLSSVDISSAVSVWICFVAFVSLVRFSCSFSVLLWKTGAQNWCHTPRDSRKRRLIGKGAVALSSVVPASAVLGLICLNTTSPFRWHKRPLFVCPLQHERPTEWNNLTKGIIILLSSQLTIMFIPTWERMR